MKGILLTQTTFRSKSYPRHAHDGYSISLMTEGTHRFVIEGERMEAIPGSVRIIHPHEAHETLESTWSHINLSLEAAEVEELAEHLGIERPVLFARLIQDHVLNELMMALHLAYREEHRVNTNDRLERLIRYLLGTHLFMQSTDPAISPTEDMANAREYVHEHAHDASLNLDEVARRAHMSKYHFLRRFKQTFGRTPHQYLQNVRIDCVRRVMARGDTPSEAAQTCGFYDQSHMIKIYQKFYGHTPGAILRPKEQ